LAATKRFSKADPWGGLFLKFDSIGFRISSGGRDVPKGRYMKSTLADFMSAWMQGMTGMIPTSDQCFDLMEKYGMLDNIRAHSIVVEQVASLIARCLRQAGEDIVLERVTAGALMHDIAKTMCLRTKEDHAIKGKEICVDHRFFEIADIVAEHL
jgi:putative nucleotidyltransferase with HDIG domain